LEEVLINKEDNNIGKGKKKYKQKIGKRACREKRVKIILD
jgi:hypothetical protein